MAASGVEDLTGRAYWDARAEDHGDGWDAAGWGSVDSQIARHAACLAHVEAGQLVLDWGCGPGDLVDMIPFGISYVGMDPAPAMIERAKAAHPRQVFGYCSRAEDLPMSYDWIVAVGAWNVEPASRALALQEIAALYDRCRVGLAVSLLRATRETVGDGHVRHWPNDVAVLANGIADRWRIRTDHHPNDIVAILWR